MSEKIDINTANAETLATISGVGPALAARIIEYRETVHPFEEVIELAAVPGISEKMVRNFEAELVVKTAVPQKQEEPEEIPLLEAPAAMGLLEAPEQPEAFLSAELPDTPPVGEEILIADTDEVAEFANEEAEADEIALVAEAPGSPVARFEESEVREERTAVPPTNTPDTAADTFAASPTRSAAASASGQTPPNWEARAQRRGCLNTLLGATFGAILGAVLTLAILVALNRGTINYAATDNQIQQQLNTEIISRTTELNQLSTRVSLMATTEAEASQTLQTDFADAQETLSEDLANNEEMLDNLMVRADELEQRLQDVAGAADTFNDFLAGLQLLLDDLEGSLPTPTPAAVEVTVSPIPTSVTPDVEFPTPTSVDSTSVAPTRTPQPTATSFTFPTNTPAPQP